ncbi:unnamed protein product, partial [Amoebophrya sp. A25]|eukprot:GSA25T00019840001.1
MTLRRSSRRFGSVTSLRSLPESRQISDSTPSVEDGANPVVQDQQKPDKLQLGHMEEKRRRP